MALAVSQGLVSNFKDGFWFSECRPKSKFHVFAQAQTLTLKTVQEYIVATSGRLYKRGVLKTRTNSLGEVEEAS